MLRKNMRKVGVFSMTLLFAVMIVVTIVDGRRIGINNCWADNLEKKEEIWINKNGGKGSGARDGVGVGGNVGVRSWCRWWGWS